MKIRQGFVSNSSSSSFIVDISDYLGNYKRCLSKQKENMLIRHGYQWVNTPSPNYLEVLGSANKIMVIDGPELKYGRIFFAWLGKYIYCNQNIEIEYLIKHHIPFRASIHSGYKTLLFDGNSLIEIDNVGLQNEMIMDDLIDNKLLKISMHKYDCSNGKMPNTKDGYF